MEHPASNLREVKFDTHSNEVPLKIGKSHLQRGKEFTS